MALLYHRGTRRGQTLAARVYGPALTGSVDVANVSARQRV
jgi:hypothetical protein